MGPTAGLAAELADRPVPGGAHGAGAVLVVGSSLEPRGSPAVFDSFLDSGHAAESPGTAAVGQRIWPPGSRCWPPRGAGWSPLLTIAAWESLPSFQERVKHALDDRANHPGLLRSDARAAERRSVREHGVPLPKAVCNDLAHWAERLGVNPLCPEVH